MYSDLYQTSVDEASREGDVINTYNSEVHSLGSYTTAKNASLSDRHFAGYNLGLLNTALNTAYVTPGQAQYIDCLLTAINTTNNVLNSINNWLMTTPVPLK